MCQRTTAPPRLPSGVRPDHRLQSGTGTLLGGGDCRISFSERGQHLDGQLLQAPVTLDPFMTTLPLHLGCGQPGRLPHRLLAHNRCPHRQKTRTPLRHFRLAERSIRRRRLHDLPPRAQAISCSTRLNSPPLDPQTSAARPLTSSAVQFSLEIGILYLGVFRWTNPKWWSKWWSDP